MENLIFFILFILSYGTLGLVCAPLPPMVFRVDTKSVLGNDYGYEILFDDETNSLTIAGNEGIYFWRHNVGRDKNNRLRTRLWENDRSSFQASCNLEDQCQSEVSYSCLQRGKSVMYSSLPKTSSQLLGSQETSYYFYGTSSKPLGHIYSRIDIVKDTDLTKVLQAMNIWTNFLLSFCFYSKVNVIRNDNWRNVMQYSSKVNLSQKIPIKEIDKVLHTVNFGTEILINDLMKMYL